MSAERNAPRPSALSPGARKRHRSLSPSATTLTSQGTRFTSGGRSDTARSRHPNPGARGVRSIWRLAMPHSYRTFVRSGVSTEPEQIQESHSPLMAASTERTVASSQLVHAPRHVDGGASGIPASVGEAGISGCRTG